MKIKSELTFCAILIFCLTISSCSKKKPVELEYIKIDTIKYKESPITEPLEEFDGDSVFYKEVCSDYGNIWRTIDKNYKIKEVDFNYNNGKLIISYFENNKSKKKIASKDYVGSWQYDANENKIIGYYGFTDRDTLMYWVFDKEKLQLVDEKGLVYKKVKK